MRQDPYHSDAPEDVPQAAEAREAEYRFHRARIYVADNDVEGIARILDELDQYRAGTHPSQQKGEP